MRLLQPRLRQATPWRRENVVGLHRPVCTNHRIRRPRSFPPQTPNASAASYPQNPPQKPSKSAKVLSKLLSMSTLPLTSYVPRPQTPLHRIHPSIKLAYILVYLVLIAKTSSISTKLGISAFFMCVQAATFPPRLWKPQLLRTLAVSVGIELDLKLQLKIERRAAECCDPCTR